MINICKDDCPNHRWWAAARKSLEDVEKENKELKQEINGLEKENKRICEISEIVNVINDEVVLKNDNLEAELLRVKSEKTGINYFGTYDHMRLSSENVQPKAELDAHKKESAQAIGCLNKDIRRLLEEGGNLQKELSELKKENERLKRVEYALTGIVSGRDNQLLAFKASLSEARKGSESYSEAHKRCEELQKELNRLKKAVVPEYLKEKIESLVRELQLKDELIDNLKRSFKKSAMQSKIDRLKKGNQDLQAKLAQLELEKAINKAPTPKFELAKDFIPFRFATSLEESLADKNSKLAKENDRLKKDMVALRQDNEHFLKCSDEFKGKLQSVAENFKFYYEHIHSRFPFISVPPEIFPELIKQILRGEDVCS